MLSAIIAPIIALWASKPLRWALGALAGLGVYEGWKYHERGIGAQVVVEKIEKKADENAKVADAVRDDVAAGKRGKRDPNRRD